MQGYMGKVTLKLSPCKVAATAQGSEAPNDSDCSKVLLALSHVEHLVTTKCMLFCSPYLQADETAAQSH